MISAHAHIYINYALIHQDRSLLYTKNTMAGARYFPLIDDGSTFKRVIFRILLILLAIGLMCVVVVPTYISYKHSATERQSEASIAGFTDAEWEMYNNDGYLNETAIVLDGRVSSIDPINDVLKLTMTFLPFGAIASNAEQPTILSQVTIISDIDLKSYAVGTRLPNTDYAVSLVGDYGNYPFDVYTGSFGLNVVKGNTTVPIPIHTPVSIEANLAQFRIDATVEEFQQLSDGSEFYLINFVIKRASTTVAFSVIIIILLWCLSLASCFITVQIVLRGRTLDLPILALNATLLFAMPALRNAQPSVPPIGTAADILGFFFNMCLVACSFLCVVLLHIMRWQVPKPTPVTAEKV
jgi:hypothetical protein